MNVASWPEKDWQRYSAYAAPEAIAAELRSARGELRRAADNVSRLELLHARRCRQVIDGEWPPRPQGADDAPLTSSGRHPPG